LNNPDQDPHLFEIVPKLAGAKVVIFNGACYDFWMQNCLTPRFVLCSKPTVIMVAVIVGSKTVGSARTVGIIIEIECQAHRKSQPT
jgi:hypothetical protein